LHARSEQSFGHSHEALEFPAPKTSYLLFIYAGEQLSILLGSRPGSSLVMVTV
jgi:hypothetical protein